jgi:hypothetical protein
VFSFVQNTCRIICELWTLDFARIVETTHGMLCTKKTLCTIAEIKPAVAPKIQCSLRGLEMYSKCRGNVVEHTLKI